MRAGSIFAPPVRKGPGSMPTLRAPVITLLLAAVAVAQDAPPAPPDARALLRPGDRLALVGGGLCDRLQHDGWLEARLQARAPELGLTVRNLGFGGDELTVQQRTAGFGAPADWLAHVEADVVVGFWGFNESFAGPAGVPLFRAELRDWIVASRELDLGEGPPRVLLCTPTPYEDLGDPLRPDAAAGNARLEPYVRAITDVAAELGVPCVDLFHPLLPRLAAPDALTVDGVHLTAAGNAELARAFEVALFGAPAAPADARLEELRAAVTEKDALWFQRYRVPDGYNVYGGRSTLEYDGLTNFAVLQREMEQLDVMVANRERAIRLLAQGGHAPEPPLPLPGPLPVPTNKPGPGPGGAHEFLSGGEAIGRMTVGEGLSVNLFADEARFPALANPVQMSFDTRGRLWVACWPTYPHAAPGAPRNDKLLVLEDVDGDGRADTATPFADDLHNPTGFEFWGGGVLLAQAPDLVFLQDTDGDGRADRRERLLHGLSSSDTHHTANSFVLGPDGALYFQEGIFHFSQVETAWGTVRSDDACVWRFEPRTGRVERHMAYGFLNPHGHVFDRWGQDFVTDGTGNENFVAGPASGWLPEGEKHAPYFTFFAQRSRPAGGTEIVSSQHLPPEFQGDLVIANVIGFQGLFRYEIQDDGAGFAAVEEEPVLFSSDPGFRPVDVEVGPDGALYVLDWQNPLIGHMQHHIRDPSRDHAHGRVYRVSAAERAPSPPTPIAGRPVPELVALLGHPESRVRYRARIELSGRDSAEVVAAVRAWLPAVEGHYYAQDTEHERLELLWLLQQHGATDRGLLGRVLASPDPHARAAAVR
ncbi:MAG: dehydrogenase, partial [Planctomycetes bacterium]|nr:dehydrogenase [Planctomycetota bacterium]